VGLDDTLRQEISTKARVLKTRLVQEYNEVTDRDMDEVGDDADAIVDKVQQKTGQSRDQVEQRVRELVKS
jgi:uncharacterized protein YjbJ (UPF0337 family)